MRSRNFILAILSVSLLSGCATLTQTFKSLTPKAIEKSVLSGREGGNGPVLVVKIDDTNGAHPQIGLEDADVVYIEEVEGGLTRIAAVFSSVIPMRIGPVRSARISDIEIMSQYGRVAFAYSGAQKKLLSVIVAANLENLGAQAQSPTIYTTDPARKQPYAMVLRADLLMQKIIDKGYVIDSARSVGWSFGDAKSEGVPISRVVLHWPAATYSAIWSKTESRWHLTHNNEPDLSETGKRLGPTTFVIQIVSITPSIYEDKFGAVTPFSNTVGTGTGYILRDGKSYTATWSRPSADVGTSWKALDGSEITFAPGQVWVALTDTEPDFTLITASAKPSPTK
ncbi:MAG: DUF3048 domain-containing protein [Candidatus Planktophila sp.]|nr:DUF3048 domain-containing protein [Candidatus Planktophila sp.]